MQRVELLHIGFRISGLCGNFADGMIDNTTFGTRKALFHTFGCKLNLAETSTVARILADRGIIRAQRGETPDIVVVNTCSVTELADKKCRQAIRAFARRFPQAAIVVTGC